MQPDLLFGLQQTSVPAFGDEELDFLRRVDVTVTRRRDSQQSENQKPTAVQKTDRPGEETLRPQHRQHRRDGHLGRVLQRQRLGHQLAEDHRQGRQRQQDGDGRRRFSGLLIQIGCAEEKRRDARREGRLSVGTEDQAGKRDTNLGDGNVAVELARIVDDRKNPRGQRMTVFRQSPEPAASNADRGKLSRDIQRRQEDQQDDDRPGGQHGRRSYLKGRRPR